MARADVRSDARADRRVWRKAAEVKAPLLVAASALDVEYEDPAVHREPSGAEGVIIVDVHGPLEHHEHPFFASFENVHRIVCEVLDRSDVKAVVMRIDSPGGVANGMSQASQAIRRHADRAGKPLYVYVDEQACSAAYGLACAADEIWGPPTAEVGSVGVILPVCDATEQQAEQGIKVALLTTGARKGDGDPSKPLTDDVRAALQARVDAIGEDFFELVSDRRGMSVEDVRALEAGVFVGADGVARGLMDGVASFGEFLSIVQRSIAGDYAAAALKSGVSAMSKNSRLALVKAYQEAELVLRAATTPGAIADATIKLAEAAKALEGSKAGGSRYYKETTKIEESIEDAEDKDAEDEDDDEPESERSPSSRPPPPAEEDAEDAEEDSEEKMEEESEDGEDKDAEDDEEPKKDEKAKKMAKKAEDAEDKDVPKKYPGASLLGHVRALVGSKDKSIAMGRLDALVEKAARYDAIVAKQAQADSGKRIEALIATAIKAGKVGPKNTAMLAQLRAMAPKRLSAFLEAMPAIVRRTDEGAIPAAMSPDGGVSKDVVLSKQAKDVIASVARTTGKSIEQATQDYLDAYRAAAGR